MTVDRSSKVSGGLRALLVVLLVPLLSACAAGMSADPSTQFGPASEKAIVLLGTSVTTDQGESRAGRSLSTYWQEYDLSTERLRPQGGSFLTKVHKGVFSDSDYRRPTVTVLEVDPGDYALIGAGFPHLMTLYVRSIDGSRRVNARAYVVDPRKYIDPQAAVDSRKNALFSVAAGQIVYIGHFEFVKLRYLDNLVSINYSQDVAAARQTLKDFPGIKGEMLILNLEEPTETARR